jgi:hypothetical protein
MALPTPGLVDLDDPLKPRPSQLPSPPAAAGSPAGGDEQAAKAHRRAKPRRAAGTSAALVGPSLAEEELVAVFVRVPTSISDRLAATIAALNADRPRRARISQQDLVGALLDRYATTELARDALELTALVDDYRQRVRG